MGESFLSLGVLLQISIVLLIQVGIAGSVFLAEMMVLLVSVQSHGPRFVMVEICVIRLC
jgi:hypothetical protein